MTVIDRILDRLREARRSATLETAGFGFPTEMVSSNPHMGDEIGPVHVTTFIRDKVKLHHETWIIGPLDEAIALLAAQKELMKLVARVSTGMLDAGLRRDMARISELLTANALHSD